MPLNAAIRSPPVAVVACAIPATHTDTLTYTDTLLLEYRSLSGRCGCHPCSRRSSRMPLEISQSSSTGRKQRKVLEYPIHIVGAWRERGVANLRERPGVHHAVATRAFCPRLPLEPCSCRLLDTDAPRALPCLQHDAAAPRPPYHAQLLRKPFCTGSVW